MSERTHIGVNTLLDIATTFARRRRARMSSGVALNPKQGMVTAAGSTSMDIGSLFV